MNYTLLVYQSEFFAAVNEFINSLYDYAQTVNKLSGVERDEFKEVMRNLLKSYWSSDKTALPTTLEDIIPQHLKEPVLTVQSKKARGEFKLDTGAIVPMFNYKGQPTDAGRIPQIFGVLSRSHSTVYNSKGEAADATNALVDILKDFNKGGHAN